MVHDLYSLKHSTKSNGYFGSMDNKGIAYLEESNILKQSYRLLLSFITTIALRRINAIRSPIIIIRPPPTQRTPLIAPSPITNSRHPQKGKLAIRRISMLHRLPISLVRQRYRPRNRHTCPRAIHDHRCNDG